MALRKPKHALPLGVDFPDSGGNVRKADKRGAGLAEAYTAISLFCARLPNEQIVKD